MNNISPLYGAIIGDIVGSFYEGRTVRSMNFNLFTKHSRFTDDTVMTMAVANMFVSDSFSPSILQQYGLMYPEAGYGDDFWKWLNSDDLKPYNSYGNGAAMRISPAGLIAPNPIFALWFARIISNLSHDNDDAIMGAMVIARSVNMAWYGYSKAAIIRNIEEFSGYNLGKTVDEIRESRDNLSFDCSAINTVQHALCAFLESTDFENAIRLAVYIGGDTDTIASMAGAIAAAYYKIIPSYMVMEANARLPEQILYDIKQFDKLVPIHKVEMIL